MVMSYLLITLVGFAIVLVSLTSIVENYLVDNRVSEQQESVNSFAMGLSDHVSDANAAMLYDSAVEYSRKMSGAREEADRLVRSAVEDANRRGEAIVDDAHRQAESIKRKAEDEIALQRAKAYQELKKDITGMAVEIAGKMVGRAIREDDQAALVDDFIRNVGDDQ